jgi:hypothetical protein
MKRILFIAALATALAVPMAALADGGHGKRGEHVRIHVRFNRGVALQLSFALKSRKGDNDSNKDTKGNNGDRGRSVLMRFATKACQAERASIGDDAFKAKYGSDKTMQACIKAQLGTSFQQKTRSKLVELSTGSVSGLGTSTVGFAGTIAGAPISTGTISTSLTVDTANAKSNDFGGSCAPATGTVTLTDSATTTNSLTESVDGALCEVGGTGASAGHVFFGKYKVTGGSGAYSSATGKGTLGFFQQAGGTAASAFEFGSIAS